jgi:hypothetical protein
MSLGSIPQASANSRVEPKPDELVYCALSWSCLQAKDASDWALSTAEWRYPDSFASDGKGDAYRHCIYSGALAQRIGYTNAYTLVMVHEDMVAASNDSNLMARNTMDVTNDMIGLGIGVRARNEGWDDQWGWIMSQCEQKVESGELAGLDGVLGAY